MFSHESLPLIAIFTIMLLCVLAAFFTPGTCILQLAAQAQGTIKRPGCKEVDSR